MQRQLQDEARISYVLGFGASHTRRLRVILFVAPLASLVELALIFIRNHLKWLRIVSSAYNDKLCNPLLPNDTTVYGWMSSILIQVKDCCLIVPSHYLSRYLLIIVRISGPTFIKPDQLDPWIKDQIKITLLPTISHLLLPNFVSCGRACPSHMTQNLVTVGAKLWTADRFLVDPWSMDYADPVW